MTETYENPLVTRYASREMAAVFSDDTKFRTWRKLWVALAESEMQLGLPITQQQVDQLKEHVNDINYDVANAREKEVRHDVMAHVYAYGEQCPAARPIIHLGATSCYVGDNADIIIMRDALQVIRRKLLNCINLLSAFALAHKDLPTLGFTHFQPAQLTTVGKRASLWLQDMLMDLQDVEHQIELMRLRGVKGTTGTQASFMTLFEGDHEKIKQLEKMVCTKMGFDSYFHVTGQTYSRKLDTQVLNVLAGIAQTAGKMSSDIRLLQNLKEIEEPFEKSQIGSSAMAYKRNPMRSERIGSLSRYLISLPINAAMTASSQWLERTLDDSANRRIAIPQAFLCADALLNIILNVVDGLVVYPKVIAKHIQEELPFMATETILMEAVKKGGDRQELHEKIRTYSMEAGKRVKQDGLNNNLIELMSEDSAFRMSKDEMLDMLDAKRFVGRAPEQVEEFVGQVIRPILEQNSELLGEKGVVNV